MPDVVVAGSINMDIVASAARHPQPGETVAGTDLRYFPGGKGANQAVASARAGASVRMRGAIGDDAFATDLLDFLTLSGVDVHGVAVRSGVPTGTALIVVDAAGENMIVVVPGANGTVDEAAVSAADARPGDVFVAQFEIPRESSLAFFKGGREMGAICVLNPAPAAPTSPDLLALVDVLVLNETELAVLSGAPIADDSSDKEIVTAVGKLQHAGFSGVVVATLGRRGAIGVVDDRVVRVEGHRVHAVDTTGAGDCFVGSLAAELARGSTIDSSLEFANAAAALCVTRPGAGPSMPARAEVDAFMAIGRT